MRVDACRGEDGRGRESARYARDKLRSMAVCFHRSMQRSTARWTPWPDRVEPDPGVVAFGRELRATRQGRRMTQTTLERRSGVDQTTISRIERGLVPGTPVRRLTMLAAGLNAVLGFVERRPGSIRRLAIELCQSGTRQPDALWDDDQICVHSHGDQRRFSLSVRGRRTNLAMSGEGQGSWAARWTGPGRGLDQTRPGPRRPVFSRVGAPCTSGSCRSRGRGSAPTGSRRPGCRRQRSAA